MSEEIRTLKLKRETLKSQLDRFDKYFNSIQDVNEQSVAQMQLRLEKLEPSFEEFNVIQTQIEILSQDKSDEVPLSEYVQRNSFEENYFEVITNAKLVVSNFREKSESNHVKVLRQENNEQTQVKLPIIKLPTFGGACNQWLEFRDAFTALVHDNKTISDIQKYYYMKSALEGEASHLIQSIAVSAANYKIAWDLLCERYENKRLLVHNHIRAIFDQIPLSRELHSKLRELFDNVNKNLRSIQSMGLNTDTWDTIIIYIIASKFDATTRRDWESFETAHELPTLADMNKFLKTKCDILEQLEENKFETRGSALNAKNKSKSQVYAATAGGQANSFTCVCCKENHVIYRCPVFLGLSVSDRINKTKQIGACLNCLRKNHLVKDCKSLSCFKCNGRHHSLLHLNLPNNNNVETQRSETQAVDTRGAQKDEKVEINKTSVCHSLEGRKLSQVILSTATLLIYDKCGNTRSCRALLDSASQSTMITEDLCKQLGLERGKAHTTISGISQTKTEVTYKTTLKLSSIDKAFQTTVSALIVPKITESLPSVSFDYSCLNIPDHIQLADPSFNKRGSIDILLGANIYWDLLREGVIQLGKNKPNLQHTQLGWVIGGNLNCKETEYNMQISCFNLETLNKNVEKFWEVESCSNSKPIYSESENDCENHFNKTYERNDRGRFVVSVPYKDNVENLGESRDIALKRLYSIENKLSKNLELKGQYNAFMREYLELNHMTRVQESEARVECYLPHHPVVKETSLTTKLRVVFDASAKTSSGISLNETQYVGPTVQNELFSILISFRWHTFVLAADITMMYRQILIRPEQRCLQRILWRFDPNDNVDCFELNTITYGTASAPYLATRCLEQLARDNETTKPDVSRVIRKHMYMDDVLTGNEDISGLLNLQRDLSSTFLSAGFELRKWHTNVPDLVNKFKLSNANLSSNIINLSANQTSKTLGIYWNSNADVIQFSVGQSKIDRVVTKRVILSEVSQIFDPLGLLAPVIILAKLLIQKLWQLQLSWDEQIPNELNIEWQIFRKQISDLVGLSIPRHVTTPEAIYYELHGFADASERAFGACIYVRTKLKSNEYVTKLVCAKSRVAPIRNINIPRLELCGAQLLANLTQKVIHALDIEFKNIIYWSDSTITLCWIKGPPNKWKTFVANRVSEIQSLTETRNWRHVRSGDNPADLISRGMTVSDIVNSKLWFEGPSWLKQDQSLWPESSVNNQSIADIPETRKATVTLVVQQGLDNFFKKYSTFRKLQRVTAYLLRFGYNCKQAVGNRTIGPLTSEELRHSFNRLINQAQREHFQSDYEYLSMNKKLQKRSKLLPLNAFLDPDGLLRVGGRLQQAQMGREGIHQIILPPKHNITKLFLEHEHKRLGHCGAQQLLASVREGYWPTQGRNLCKGIIRRCVSCFKAKPKTLEQLMGNLPKVRVTPAPPFYNTGIDYAGPLLIRDKKHRGSKLIKAYVCLFICLSVKAVHIEVVTSLNSESFIAALRRFTSRRGNPKNIYSDNGLNFVGANKEIQELYEFLKNENNSITDHLSSDYTSWHFIPPHAPNFGGIWEANIKCVKNHLRRIVGNAHLTYEELSTVLTQIESILNSRPLTPMTEDPEDLDVLTPAHFLIGRRLTSVPDPSLQAIPDNKLSRFQYIQKLQQQYWLRWSKEYLVELQRRNKWQRSQPNIHLGALVLLREDNLPPLQWPMGRVTALHPGADGLIRVVTVKTKNSVVKRSVSKICLLPFDENECNEG